MKLDIQKSIKRLGIFVFYDKHGYVSESVKYFLSDLIPNLSKLIIISNGDVEYATYKYFQTLTPDVFVRENKGLDAAAYQMGMLIYEDRKELEKYDEIILLNDTCYGPVYSFEEIFTEMNQRDLDFWGISAGYESVDGWNALPHGYIPDHIQTFFTVFRKSMVMSAVFREYWESYNREWNTFYDVVTKHELIMTDYFAKKGFLWDVYVDIGARRSTSLNKNCNLNGYSSFIMLHDFHSPFIKRKTFALDRKERLVMAGGEDVSRSMRFLKETAEFDTDLIYKDLIKRYNIWDLYDSLNMNYVISDSMNFQRKENKAQCLIVIYCGSLRGVKESISYLKKISKEFDIIMLLSEDINEDRVKDMMGECQICLLDIVLCPATVKGIAALWLISETANKYKFLCFTHDAEYYWGEESDTVYDSVFYCLQENTIKNANYINQCLNMMEEHSELGLLETPFLLHNKYYNFLNDFWGDDFENVRKLSNTLRLNCQLDATKPGISRGGAFICRTEALMPVLEWGITTQDYLKGNLFEFITPVQWEKILPYIAQHNDYLTGVVMTEEFASVYITNLQYYFQDLLKMLRPLVDDYELSYNGFSQMVLQKIETRQIEDSDETINCLNQDIINLTNILKEKEDVIQTLFPMTSLKFQLRLRLKKYLPKFLYNTCVCMKRLVWGPRNICFNYND